MVKSFRFVSGGMVVHADKVERGAIDGMVTLLYDGARVASIDMDLSRLKVLHLYKDDKYISVTYSVYYKYKEGKE